MHNGWPNPDRSTGTSAATSHDANSEIKCSTPPAQGMSTARSPVTGVVTASSPAAMPATGSTMDGRLPPKGDRTLRWAFRTDDPGRTPFGKRAKKLIQRGRAADGVRGHIIVAKARATSPREHERGPPDGQQRRNHDV